MQLTIWSKEELDTMSDRVTLIYVDKVNINGRIYDKNAANKIVSESSEKRVFGEFIHEEYQLDFSEINTSKISHYVRNVKYEPEKDIVSGDLCLLETPTGEFCKSCLETGKYVVRSRVMGTVDEFGIVAIEKLLAFDIISAEKDSYADYTDKIKNKGII